MYFWVVESNSYIDDRVQAKYNELIIDKINNEIIAEYKRFISNEIFGKSGLIEKSYLHIQQENRLQLNYFLADPKNHPQVLKISDNDVLNVISIDKNNSSDIQMELVKYVVENEKLFLPSKIDLRQRILNESDDINKLRTVYGSGIIIGMAKAVIAESSKSLLGKTILATSTEVLATALTKGVNVAVIKGTEAALLKAAEGVAIKAAETAVVKTAEVAAIKTTAVVGTKAVAATVAKATGSGVVATTGIAGALSHPFWGTLIGFGVGLVIDYSISEIYAYFQIRKLSKEVGGLLDESKKLFIKDLTSYVAQAIKNDFRQQENAFIDALFMGTTITVSRTQ